MSIKRPGESHQEKMLRKKGDRQSRVGYAQRNDGIKKDVERFSAHWRGVRGKNGVSSRQAREDAASKVAE